MTDKVTSIRIHQSTKEILESHGNYGDSHEDIIKMLLQHYDSSITFENYK